MYYGDFSCFAAALESGKRAGLYPYYCDEYFYIEYDFTICGKYDLSYGKFNRKGKPQTPQVGPHDDFYSNRREYTPVCLIVLKGKTGLLLCAAVWITAIIGIIVKACWITCPKWFSSVIYIGMGWLCVFAFVPIVHSLSPAGFGWLLAGGIIYTVGGIIYALKLPIFNSHHKNFGSHEIFHLFVMGGSVCHFIVMYFFVMPMPA